MIGFAMALLAGVALVVAVVAWADSITERRKLEQQVSEAWRRLLVQEKGFKDRIDFLKRQVEAVKERLAAIDAKLDPQFEGPETQVEEEFDGTYSVDEAATMVVMNPRKGR